MAFLFNAPDFYSMAKDRRDRFDKQIAAAVQVMLTPARKKQADEAMRKEQEREARAIALEDERMARSREMMDFHMGRGAFQQQPPQQPPQEPGLEQKAPADPLELIKMGLNPALMGLNRELPKPGLGQQASPWDLMGGGYA
jgi:hypothetical protein